MLANKIQSISSRALRPEHYPKGHKGTSDNKTQSVGASHAGEQDSEHFVPNTVRSHMHTLCGSEPARDKNKIIGCIT